MTSTQEPIVTLTLRELELMLREPVRDKRYLETKLGPVVTAYLSWKDNEAGAAARTLDQYERDLARMCVMLANRTTDEVTTDDLREVRGLVPKGVPQARHGGLQGFLAVAVPGRPHRPRPDGACPLSEALERNGPRRVHGRGRGAPGDSPGRDP
jgi:hypothetical protein